jgi:hypothetical protein
MEAQLRQRRLRRAQWKLTHSRRVAIQRLRSIVVSYDKLPMRYSAIAPGCLVNNLLHSGHPERFYDFTGMTKPTFQSLITGCQRHSTLRCSRDVRIAEKLAIFLYIVRNGVGQRNARLFFNRAPGTISGVFHQVLRTMLKLHLDQVELPADDQPLDERIAGDDKFYPFFQDCIIGVIDGTHIRAFVEAKHAPAFRDRKGFLSQNVLGVCTFDLQFSYVYPGWEGSAHDVRVLDDAMRSGGFEIIKRWIHFERYIIKKKSQFCLQLT